MQGQNSSLVIDAGAIVTKAGYAGVAGPLIVFPSYVGRPRFGQSKYSQPTYVGDDAVSQIGILSLQRPIEVRK